MFTLKFSTANAAFDDPESEVSWILHHIARRVAAGITDGIVTDSYGETIGHWDLKD